VKISPLPGIRCFHPQGTASPEDFLAVGILDIAGFESFEFNSLEQLFINLSNETLQQFFNDFVFKSELSDYAKEDVVIDNVDFVDNEDVLDLIQAVPSGGIGITMFLDYGCKLNSDSLVFLNLPDS
jgi:myosin heavy subunit